MSHKRLQQVWSPADTAEVIQAVRRAVTETDVHIAASELLAQWVEREGLQSELLAQWVEREGLQ